MAPTLLAVHAHPDDESSKGAATVARYASAGVRCVLVTATGGEAGDVLNAAMDLPGIRQNLAEIRRQELAEAAAIIGYDEVILLGYRDSGMPDTQDNRHPAAFVNASPVEVLGRLVAIVRAEKPQVLLGYDSHEWYPHPDHIRIHELGVEVFNAAGDPARFPEAGPPWEVSKLYAPLFTVARVAVLHRAMEERGMESPFAGWLSRLEEVDGAEKRVTSVDVTDQIERGRAALRAHRTQIDPDGFWFQVPVELVREVYPYEDFELLRTRVEVDPDEDDLFAGIEV